MNASPTRLVLLLGTFFLSSCATQIQHGLEERDANEILSVLIERGFKAQKVPEKGKKPTWAIELDEAEASDALRLLTELKLPRLQRATTKTVIQNQGLIETPSAERLRQLEAQEGDLEEALETMDGVAGASVELVVPLAPRPGQPPVPSKASVLLRARPEALERLGQQRSDLRALVAGGVDGLKAEDVVLVIDPVTFVTVPARTEAVAPRLRPLIIGMGAALTLLALLLVVLATRLLRARGRAETSSPAEVSAPVAHPPAAPRPPQRPIVNAAVQRKVA
jgi:type III secretion protein J